MSYRVPEVLALGETMLSLVAAGGVRLVDATTMHVTVGGAESNACAGLARLGVSAAWIGRVGDDPPGERILRDLAAAGVDLRWARRDPSRPTGLMLRETTGAPAHYARTGSAASAMAPEDLTGVPVEDARAVLVSAITPMLGEGPAAAATALLERARGMRVVDANLRLGLWGSGRERELVLPLLARADVVLAGAAELATLFDARADERALADRCAALGVREVVVRRGALGAAARDDAGRWIDQAPERVDEVDPVGAGDAFTAGYLAARLRAGSVVDALAQGARCGAATAGTLGDIGLIGGQG